MPISNHGADSPWLLLTLSLPAKRASKRVEVWRMLQRYGAIALGNSGYLLPNNPTNRERFEWLATAIRKYTGEASVVKVHSIDNLSSPQLARRFNQARDREYKELLAEFQKLSSVATHSRSQTRLSRLRSRFREIAEIDFFDSPMRKRTEDLLARAVLSSSIASTPSANSKHYRRRLWVTRSRPGIDRSASAWLIRRFIDKKARFAFAAEGSTPTDSVPFDMFHSGGFGHRGEDCTFETLQKEFGIRDRRVSAIGEMIHDADLSDDKFGRKEAFGIDEVLKGWARLGWADQRILDAGIEMIEGLYHSLP